MNNANGYYIYLETTASRPNQTARLLSPVISAAAAVGSGQCLTFWYFMYGAHVNRLSVRYVRFTLWNSLQFICNKLEPN